MSRFFAHWLIVGVALAITAWILPGVHVTSLAALALAALILGAVNAVVRPVVAALTLPLTIATFGLFLLVVNGIAFGLAAWLAPGFWVDGAGAAILGALLVSAVSWLTGHLLGSDDEVHESIDHAHRHSTGPI
jgi:putative membrane protein